MTIIWTQNALNDLNDLQDIRSHFKQNESSAFAKKATQEILAEVNSLTAS